jgi:hypothetical protein
MKRPEKQVRRWPIAIAGTVALALGSSCDRSTSTNDETTRAALVGDPIESVARVQGLAPVTITNATSGPDGGTIDKTSFTMGMFNEDDATLCPGGTLATAISGLPNLNFYEAPCGIMSDFNPQHPARPYPPFDDLSVVEVAVNVGSIETLHWDWEYKAYYQAPFGEFWTDVVDQNGDTTTVIEKISAPAPWGFRPVLPGYISASGPYETGPQPMDLDLKPWAGQKIKVRFILHTSYDPNFFSYTVPPGFVIGTGSLDAAPSKLYVSNLGVESCRVDSIELLDAGSPITTDPGGGLRIFPDKPPPGTGPDRDLVRVVAHTNRPNCPVTLRSFDVDDPSSDSDIDPNGPAGNDNLGTANGNRCGDFLPGGACQMNTTSDADRKAVVGFVVSKQPGDNFVIVAGTDQDQVSKVKLVVSGNTSVLQDGDGRDVPNARVAASPKLTVWRHLHVQVDSMGRVTNNHVAGTIVRAAGLDVSGTPVASNVTVSTRLVVNRFTGGRITFNGKSFGVLSNGTDFLRLDDPTGQVSRSDAGAAFVLYDDDSLSGPGLLNGDEGFDVGDPDLRLLADSDDSTLNVLAPAYIRPTYDIPGDGSQPFDLNIEEAENPFSGQMDVGTSDYWFAYLLGGYQGAVDSCWDPAGEGDQGFTIRGQGSTMFLETIRDGVETPLDNGATTTAHEVGHLFRAKHGQGGLMGDDADGTTITDPTFSGKSIRAIRSRVKL